MKDWKETLEHLAVIWASLALIPGIDIQDIFLISVLKGLFNITYAQMAGMYYIIAFLVLVLLAPKKLKTIYYKIRRWFN